MWTSFGSVVAGYLVWTVVFLGGGAGVRAAFAEVHRPDGGTDHLGLLLGYLALSVLASLAAGATTARIARDRPDRWVLVLAVLLLATGILAQVGSWSLLPIWYHLAFLVSLVPATLLGGRLATR